MFNADLTYRLTMEAKGTRRVLLYKPHYSTMYWEDTGEPIDVRSMGFMPEHRTFESVIAISHAEPGIKLKGKLKTIKIQVGLNCNLACKYCNQASQSHAVQGNMDDARAFIRNLGKWFDGGPKKDGTGIRFELWGGEPFVYPKQVHYLASVLRSLYPQATLLIITNGTMLTDEIIEWLDKLRINVGISHDGPAYDQQRGPDPLVDPAKRALILKLYNRLAPFGRISFNVVLTRINMSLAACRADIAQKLGVPLMEPHIETEEILQPYDESGLAMSPQNAAEHQQLTETVFWEAVTHKTIDIQMIRGKCEDFASSLAFARPSMAVGQKCGMDSADVIAVSLKGDVLTCQNTAADSRHKIGTVDDFDAIALDTSTHFSKRVECVQCPVVQICKGACMYNEGVYWERGCDNAYSYYKAILATALFYMTRMVLESIEGPVIRRVGLPTIDHVINPQQALAYDKSPDPQAVSS